MLSDLISSELPYLRRYARGVLGERGLSDDAVEDLLSSLLSRVTMISGTRLSRTELFRALDEHVLARSLAGTPRDFLHVALQPMTVDQRRVTLLAVVEGFSIYEVSSMLDMSMWDVEQILHDAEAHLRAATCTGVLIIEDDPHVSRLLSLIVEQAGHWVVGVAHTHSDAVLHSDNSQIGLILSDLRLADRSCGQQAVREIQQRLNRAVPTIYITAYPSDVELFRGGMSEFVIPKPFEIGHVKNVVDSAAYARI